ncbi:MULTISPECIES: PaaI family thioesterase [unclassified Frankia]|uniref:PaaI family thioesterase n=1 Tax=unclassified Frankia TaxID=2632575 RepID=UPI002AD44F30|nr:MULTISPECIES: PaaI family thioesterase [unclassified Frankia]
MSDNGPRWTGSDFQVPPRAGGAVALCGACSRTGQCHLGMLREQLDDGVLRAHVTCSPEHEGGPNVAHGGWTAGIMDEVLGHLPMHLGTLAVTATLEIKFIRPVPIGRDLLASSWLDRREGQRLYVVGELRLAATNAELATAKGVFVARDRAHFDRQQAWLAEQDAAGDPAPRA